MVNPETDSSVIMRLKVAVSEITFEHLYHPLETLTVLVSGGFYDALQLITGKP